MRKQIREQIVELLPTIREGIEYACQVQSLHNATTILEDCHLALTSITNNLKSELTSVRFAYYNDLLTQMTDSLAFIQNLITRGQSATDWASQFSNLLGALNHELISGPESKISIVFMPYKSSMWDSLESIWIAASTDANCNAKVVPIPYYDRNPDRSLGTLHYEGEDLPDYVPVVHYDDYDLAEQRPDIAYIHNPYDEYNLVTSVDPRYYSSQLKKHAGTLVYVPYFISGAYANIQVFAQKHLTNSVSFVDKIIVQSNLHKQLYMECGINERKLLALGSPKLDVIANLSRDNANIPIEWTKKLVGKKSIVLNSSIGALLNDPNYFIKLKRRISIILSYRDLVLIWRPHPLLEATITSMKPSWHNEYQEMIRMIENADNGILDKAASTAPATIVSDAMISDISSWVRQYIATGKPVLMLNGRSEMKNERICVFDHFSCYFYYDGYSIEDFCGMLIQGTDPNKESRLSDLRNSVLNLDGSCGQQIHDQVISALE